MENDLAEIDKNQITTRRGKGKKRKSTINTDRKGFESKLLITLVHRSKLEKKY